MFSGRASALPSLVVLLLLVGCGIVTILTGEGRREARRGALGSGATLQPPPPRPSSPILCEREGESLVVGVSVAQFRAAPQAFSPDMLASVLWQDRLVHGHFKTPPYTTSRMQRVPKSSSSSSSSSDDAGHHEFILVHNPGRGQKRKGKEPLALVSMPFNPAAFNFHRAAQSELLYFFHPQREAFPASASPLAALTNGAMSTRCIGSGSKEGMHPLFINPFPLGPMSGLLVPYIHQNRSQVMAEDLLLVGMSFAATLTIPFLRMGYNSLGAGASVNHFHFQIWQCPQALPIELAAVRDVHTWQVSAIKGDTIRISKSTDFPIHFLRYDFSPDVMAHVVAALTHCMGHMVAQNIPHNMVFTARMAFLVPRQGMEPWRSMLPGFPEMVGQLFTVQEEDFRSITGEELAAYYSSHVDVGAAKFDEIAAHCSAWHP